MSDGRFAPPLRRLKTDHAQAHSQQDISAERVSIARDPPSRWYNHRGQVSMLNWKDTLNDEQIRDLILCIRSVAPQGKAKP